MSTFRWLAMGGLVLGLSACGGEPAPGPAAPAAGATAAPAPAPVAAPGTEPAAAVAEVSPLPTGDYRIIDVRLGKALDGENNVADTSEVFAPGDTLHLAVVGVGSSQGLTLSAHWRDGNGATVARNEQVLVPDSPTITTFSLAHPQGWPPGRYQVEVAINGRAAENRAFDVR